MLGKRQMVAFFSLIYACGINVCFVCFGLFAVPLGVIGRLCSMMWIVKDIPVSILRKSISGRHRPVRVADWPMTARCRFT